MIITAKKGLSLSLIAMLVLLSFGFALTSSAQTALTCSPSSGSVAVNQSITLTATGGDGSYVWSGNNLNITNPTGQQFMVSYNQAGAYQVNVQSAGQTAICTVNVVSSTSGDLLCLPATQTIALGQSSSYTATGGDGTYQWSASDLSIANPTGSGFTASYASSGTKTLTVSSAGQIATCTTIVMASSPAPGFPSTGGGYIK